MDSSDQDACDKARFATVLQNLKRENIPSLASSTRYSGHPSTGTIDVPTTPQPVSCRLLSQTTCGSFNAVFKVLFADGTLWVLKVPANGHRQCWNAHASEALTSEAFTMRLIRRETTIPVPEVFAFDASLDNELGCPFILMELIHGKPLLDVWFDQGVSQAKREQIRIRSLHDLAEAMAQLNTCTFSQGGSLIFDAKGGVIGIGSSNLVDLETQYANMRSPDYDNTMAFCQSGPFSDPNSYLLSLLDARAGSRERCMIEQGAYKLLRLFIEWSLVDTSGQEKPFVLAHPDFDNQNILVNNDGSLAGIIDWDWIAAVPHCVGPQSFPKFLTKDYDPGNYGYDVEAGEPMEGCAADSPSELASYRAMYAQFMESYLSKEDRVNLARGRRARVRKSRKEAADMTRRSLITTTLHLATKAPSETPKMMRHLFSEIEKFTAADWSEESSTADSGEDHGSEEGSNEARDTEPSEVENSDVVDEQTCIPTAGSDEEEVSIERLSIDELMDAIEKLTGMSSTGEPVTQDPADLQDTSLTEGEILEHEVETHDLSKMDPNKKARKPRAARICGWVHNKLRRGAMCLHKGPKNGDLGASAGSLPTSGPVKAARTFCGWTEKKLRRVANCLHCDDESNDEIKTKSEIEAVRIGGIHVLTGLQTKLRQLTQKLYRKGNNDSETSEGRKEEASQVDQATSFSKELNRAEMRSVCARFARMVKDNKLSLTVDQQVAVAHWVVQTLQNSDYSDVDLGNTRGQCGEPDRDVSGGDIDAKIDSGYEDGHEDGDGRSANGRDGNGDTEEIGVRDDEDINPQPLDQACIQQPLHPSLSETSNHFAAGTARTTSYGDEPVEVSQAAVDQEEDDLEQEDTGTFDLLDVCIALAKDDLDERRAQRLRDGFFGLLNQIS